MKKWLNFIIFVPFNWTTQYYFHQPTLTFYMFTFLKFTIFALLKRFISFHLAFILNVYYMIVQICITNFCIFLFITYVWSKLYYNPWNVNNCWNPIDIKLTRCKVSPIELQHNNILPLSLTLALVQLFFNDQFRRVVTYWIHLPFYFSNLLLTIGSWILTTMFNLWS